MENFNYAQNNNNRCIIASDRRNKEVFQKNIAPKVGVYSNRAADSLDNTAGEGDEGVNKKKSVFSSMQESMNRLSDQQIIIPAYKTNIPVICN